MIVIVLAFATALIVAWLIQLFMVSSDDMVMAAYAQVFSNMLKINALKLKDEEKVAKLSEYRGFTAKVMRLFLSGNSEKEIAKIEKQNERLQQGDFSALNPLVMPGYVIQRKLPAVNHSDVFKNIIRKFNELYGKKYSEHLSKNLMAQLISFPFVGVGLSLAFGALVFNSGNTTIGFAIMGIGAILILVVVYALYDELDSKSKKRQEAISRQFPNVVSKLALLVTSGMILDEAWSLAAYSSEQELYIEMRKTSEDRRQSISPDAAFESFIKRCNTKETSKLASAILQNLSKGNSELGRLLRDMAKESWLERKHTAKRDAERANSKLMIPTMLMLLVILVMIIVPIMMSFQGGL